MHQYDPLHKWNVKLYTPIKIINKIVSLNTVKYSYGFFTLQKPRNLRLLHSVICGNKSEVRFHILIPNSMQDAPHIWI